MGTPERELKIRRVAAARQPGVVVLEDVHDPHNAAAVLRSCDAFGIQTVHLIFGKEKPYNPRKIGRESSSSANRWLDFILHRSTEDCLDQLHADGVETIATVLDSNAEAIFDAVFEKPKTAFLFGNEHRGLSDVAIQRACRLISIPMLGMVQSLNLSVTAGICLYEWTRQRRHRTDGSDARDPTEVTRLAGNMLAKGRKRGPRGVS